MARTETAVARRRPTGRRMPPAKHAEPQFETCRLCTGTTVDEIVDAGGDIGRVHRSCFIEWDRRQEALEMAACIGFPGHPGEFWAELEMDGTPLARAA
jgi:hypothetical protein